MTTRAQLDLIEADWLEEFRGLTLKGLRPAHNEGSSLPYVWISFHGDIYYEVTINDDTFFEGCYVNTLRKAQPITGVKIKRRGNDYQISVNTNSFSLFKLSAVSRVNGDVFPFSLEEGEAHDPASQR